MQTITTTDLSDFGIRELKMLHDLIGAYIDQGVPDGFRYDEVVPMMNKNSGYVFLTNSEYQAAMLNGSRLEIWNSCPNCGHEGFEEDCHLIEDGCNNCKGE